MTVDLNGENVKIEVKLKTAETDDYDDFDDFDDFLGMRIDISERKTVQNKQQKKQEVKESNVLEVVGLSSAPNEIVDNSNTGNSNHQETNIMK